MKIKITPLTFLAILIFCTTSPCPASPTIGPIQKVIRLNNSTANRPTPIRDPKTPLQALARKAMIATLLNDTKELKRIAALAEQIETTHAKNNISLKSISRKMALLDTWAEPNPTQRTELLQRIRATKPSPWVLRQTTHALQTQPQREIKRLRKEDRYNRFAALGNYFFDIGSGIVAGNPQRIFRLATDFLLIPESSAEITTHNRKAINLYRRNRHSIPATDENKKLARYIDKLERRKKSQQADELIHRGKWHMANQRWASARNAFAYALELEPKNKKARELRLESARNLSAQYRQQLRTSSERLATEIQNDASEIRDTVLNLIIDPITVPTNTEALEAKLQQTDKRRRRDIWQYILLGDRLDEQARPPNTKRGKAHRFIDSLSLLLPFEWIIRGIQIQYTQPVPDPAWRDAATRYLRIRTAEKSINEQDQQLASRLAKSYEKQQRFDQALHYRQIALLSSEQSSREKSLAETRNEYDQKIARLLWRKARNQTDPDIKYRLTQYITTRFPDTKAAEQALKHQHNNSPQQKPSLQITREELIQWPALWLGQGIDLSAEWFDQESSNGEMTAEGIYLYGDAGQRISFNLRWNNRKKTNIERLSDIPTQKLLAPHLRAWKQEAAARNRSEILLNRRKIPIDLEGAAGPSGFELAPHLVPHTFDQQTQPLYSTPQTIRR